MRYALKVAFLFFIFSHCQITQADNKIAGVSAYLASIPGSCQACIDSEECYKIENECRRNCVVSLLSSEEKTNECILECTSDWNRCLTAARSKCKDYCPPG